MRIIATSDDIKTMKAILEKLKKDETTDETHVDWENAEMQFGLMRVINNIENFDNYFKTLPETEKRYYTAECSKCGWFGGSQYCNGGGAIADTGDYSVVTCPICDNEI
jgi:hypothetical protein